MHSYGVISSKLLQFLTNELGGWTTEKHIVNGERVTLEDLEKAVKESGGRTTLLYAFDRVGDVDIVIGTLQIQPDEKNPEEAEIGLFSVNPAYQSRGIGGRLIRTSFEKMKELGYSRAVIHVLENRPELLAWYRKLGFVETGERIPFVWPELLKIKDLHFLTLKKDLKDDAC